MDNPLEEIGANELDEIAIRDYYRKVSVYDENGDLKFYHHKGRVNEVLVALSEHGGIDVSQWRVVENE